MIVPSSTAATSLPRPLLRADVPPLPGPNRNKTRNISRICCACSIISALGASLVTIGVWKGQEIVLLATVHALPLIALISSIALIAIVYGCWNYFVTKRMANDAQAMGNISALTEAINKTQIATTSLALLLESITSTRRALYSYRILKNDVRIQVNVALGKAQAHHKVCLEALACFERIEADMKLCARLAQVHYQGPQQELALLAGRISNSTGAHILVQGKIEELRNMIRYAQIYEEAERANIQSTRISNRRDLELLNRTASDAIRSLKEIEANGKISRACLERLSPEIKGLDEMRKAYFDRASERIKKTEEEYQTIIKELNALRSTTGILDINGYLRLVEIKTKLEKLRIYVDEIQSVEGEGKARAESDKLKSPKEAIDRCTKFLDTEVRAKLNIIVADESNWKKIVAKEAFWYTNFLLRNDVTAAKDLSLLMGKHIARYLIIDRVEPAPILTVLRNAQVSFPVIWDLMIQDESMRKLIDLFYDRANNCF